MHLKRILSALVALPCLYLLIAKGGPFWFSVLISVASIIALSEYYYITLHKTGVSVFAPIPLVGFLASQAMIYCAFRYPGRFDVIAGLVVLDFIVAAMIALRSYSSDSPVLDVVAKQVQGVVYIPVLLSTLVLVRGQADEGIAWVFFILVLVAFCDTGAFYAGTFFGKHKLCPRVSPGKTIEGFIGGLSLTLIGGLVIRHFFFPEINLVMTAVFLVTLSIVGPFGDLFESALKRTGGVKDSGSIIPGHGGMLDRIDALLFVSPVAYVFKTWFLG
jgi:phosphatidate cytidylyltransferase